MVCAMDTSYRELVYFDPDLSIGLVTDYPSIVLHAISRRQPASLDHDCLYCQLNTPLHAPLTQTNGPSAPPANDQATPSLTEDQDNSEGDGGHESDFEPIGAELYFVPQDPGQVHRLFERISACAAMHPDSGLSDDDPDLDFDETAFDPNDLISAEELTGRSPDSQAMQAFLESKMAFNGEPGPSSHDPDSPTPE
ncbi:hypothetical protein H4R34_003726 [Dimargaris verticillata]|uniref:Regulator of volume decrease after cellular swelling-domain-containing protein n=1 Tax=Dimargaris verticillata TaxID=2761393 RepID=A0A9W8E8T3_9FUNG|nr:hypothetical protein H4R34_003726 [Dimargaris verticillata]